MCLDPSHTDSTRLVSCVTPGARGWSSHAPATVSVTSVSPLEPVTDPAPLPVTHVSPLEPEAPPVTHLHDHPHCGQRCHQALGMGRAHSDGDAARVQAAVEGRDELDACKDTTAALGDTGRDTAGQCCSSRHRSPGMRGTLPQHRWAMSAAQHQGQHEEAEKARDRGWGK